MTDHVTGDGAGWPSLISALNPLEEADLVGRLGGRDILLPENEARQYPLRGHLWQAGPQARGQVLVLPGFTEFCEKYALFARRLVARDRVFFFKCQADIIKTIKQTLLAEWVNLERNHRPVRTCDGLRDQIN